MKKLLLAATLSLLIAPGLVRTAQAQDSNSTEMQMDAHGGGDHGGGGHGGDHGGDHGGGHGGDHGGGDHGGGWHPGGGDHDHGGHDHGGGWFPIPIPIPYPAPPTYWSCYSQNAYGRIFIGSGVDQWQARNEAMYNCQANSYGPAPRCYVYSCRPE